MKTVFRTEDGLGVNNLGLNNSTVKYLKAKYPNKSIHYAIQQELKLNQQSSK